MAKSEYKEASEQDNYWYEKSIMHRTEEDRGFERYDRPVCGLSMEEEEFDSMTKYNSGIHHFMD